jgi:hypothetical protein
MMRKLYFTFGLIFISILSRAQCPTGTISTQAQIDNFKTNYPLCTSTGSNLNFDLREGVSNLDGLSNLTSIAGSLHLIYTPLTNLSGLSNLVSVNSLVIAVNGQLTSLSDLSSLKSINSLNIGYSKLTSLAGLENLESLNSMLLNGNALLSNIRALDDLPAPTGRTDFFDNPLISDCIFEFICNGVRTPFGSLGAMVQNNGPGCSSVSQIVSACGTLPVTLVNFDVKGEGATAVLNWSTSTETNSNHFEIQRSQTGKTWSAIGKVVAQGESKTAIIYNFTDEAPLQGYNYYRLKMVDHDQSFAYSAIKGVSIKTNVDIVFPNPVEEKLIIRQASILGIDEIAIYNSSGKAVKTSPYLNDGIAVNHLSAGFYTANVKFKDGTSAKYKFVKK